MAPQKMLEAKYRPNEKERELKDTEAPRRPGYVPGSPSHNES
jgi:hypothetical protein